MITLMPSRGCYVISSPILQVSLYPFWIIRYFNQGLEYNEAKMIFWNEHTEYDTQVNHEQGEP